MKKIKELYNEFRYVWNERRYQQFVDRYEEETGEVIMVEENEKPDGDNANSIRDERLGVGKSRSFKTRCFRKFVENVLSVKVWVIFVILVTSSVFLCIGLVSGTVWASLNAGVISTIFALRESFKISRIRTPDIVIGNDKDIFV